LLFVLFFLSGLSGLIYQVAWVRELSTSFGATIHTTSLVVAIFMLGLGLGSYIAGLWADRRYAQAPDSLLRAYGVFELLIAALGLGVTLALPRLQSVAAGASSYVKGADGWFVVSMRTYVNQAGIAVALLLPITLLMGGTLTLLIRHLVRADVETASGSRVGALYAVNTFGAAAGAYLTDFSLVPALGLRETLFVAIGLNLVAGAGAILLSGRSASVRASARASVARASVVSAFRRTGKAPVSNGPPEGGHYREQVLWTAFALMLAGFAGMGLEIVWLRHFTILLGGFRAVFSLVMTVLLAAIAAGALIGGALARRVTQPALAFMALQTLIVLAALAGLRANTYDEIRAAGAGSDVLFNLRPMLLEIGLPALLMGTAFPLGNAMIQHSERAVGRRAGVLYLANTVGAVAGSLTAGYVLLPAFGMQGSAAMLAVAAGATLAPLYLVCSANGAGRRATMTAAVASLVIVAVAVDAWLRLPDNYLLLRALPAVAAPEKLTFVREGINEAVAVTERPGRGRALLTNGHAMSSTALLDQRYMRALAHIPLLSMDSPRRVLVIGFGVGNSTSAAALHPSVERVEVADLSRQILELATTFREANGNVLTDPRVAVFVNDGRQHLRMQPEQSYDLITLEPPPIAHAGVGALYSREFYELARTRLKPGGYLSQWLPSYQVPPATALAMARAFVDVFPHAVVLSGTQAELLLVGTTADRIEIDPDKLARRLESAPKVLADLRKVDLGSVKEIVGTFVGAPETLAKATQLVSGVSDDRPLQEYDVRSAIATPTGGLPAGLVDLPSAAKWCPRCFNGEDATVEGLDAYLALMDEVYHANTNANLKVRATSGIAEDNYLSAVLPDTANVHNILGVTLLQQQKYPEAAAEFRAALKRQEDSADANRNLGTALVAMGNVEEAIIYLQRAVRLAPDNAFARKELEDAERRARR
jgi:spermidine synthase